MGSTPKKATAGAQPGWEVCAEATTGEEAVTLARWFEYGLELAIERQKVRTVLEWLQESLICRMTPTYYSSVPDAAGGYPQPMHHLSL